MSTESEVKLARYSEVAKVADVLGRVIGVRRLKPSEQTKVAGFCPELYGYDEMTNTKGDTIRIPHRMPLILASSVCMIDDVHIPFPRTRGELDAVYDRLDKEGIAAAGEAMIKLNPDLETRETDEDTAKNL